MLDKSTVVKYICKQPVVTRNPRKLHMQKHN